MEGFRKVVMQIVNKLRFSKRFSVAALLLAVAIIAGAIVYSIVLRDSLALTIYSWHTERTADFVNEVYQSHTIADTEVGSEEYLRVVREFASDVLSQESVSGLTIYDGDGDAIWSNVPGRELGNVYEVSKVAEALKGHVVTELKGVTDGGADGDDEHKALVERIEGSEFVEVFVPLKDSFGRIGYVAEIYDDLGLQKAILATAQKTTLLSVLISIFLFVPTIFALVYAFNERKERDLRRFDEMFDTSPVPMVIDGPKGTIVLANVAAAHLFGVAAPEMLVGMGLDDLVRVMVDGEQQSLGGLLDTIALDDVESLLLKRNELRYCTIRSFPLFGSQRDSVDERLVMIEDISSAHQNRVERERLVKRLQDEASRTTAEKDAAEERYRRMFETSTDAIMLLNKEAFLDCNLATLRMFGFEKKEDFIGKHPVDISPPTQPGGMRSTEVAEKHLSEVFQYGKSFFSWTHRRANGEDFPATVLLTPLRGEGGDVIQATVRDVTEDHDREKKMQQIISKYRSYTEAVPVGIFETDTVGNCTFVNEVWTEIAGLDNKGAAGAGWESALHPDDRQKVRDAWGAAAQTGKKFDMRYRFKRADGRVTWVHGMSTMLCDASTGKCSGFIGVIVDITERVALEGRIARIIENGSDLVYSYAPDGTVQYVSPQIEKYGYNAKEVIGTKFISYVAEEDRAAFGEGIHPLMSGKEERFQTEARFMAKDGSIVWLDAVSTAMRDGDGKLLGVSGVARDVTLRYEKAGAEERLHELSELYSINPEFILELDMQGKVLARNKAARDAMEAGAPFMTEDDHVLEVFLKPFKELAAAESLENREVAVIDDKGKRSYIVSGVRTEKGDKVFLTIRDYTDVRIAEEKVRKLDALKSGFITALTHVMRTPLNEIRWSLEALTDGDFAPLSKEQKTFVRQALTSEARVLRVLTNMNTVFDIERGTMVLEKHQTSLSSLVSSVIDTLSDVATMADVKVVFTVKKGVAHNIDIDTKKIRNALESILMNAMQYSREGGKVAVTLSQKGDMVMVTVADKGIGIPEGEEMHIFECFYRASNAQLKNPNGVGAALYIAKAVIEKHGGTLKLTSTENKGTTVTIALPA